MNAEQPVKRRIEIRRERPVKKLDVAIQPFARQDSRGQIHLAPMIEQRLRPSLPGSQKHYGEERNNCGLRIADCGLKTVDERRFHFGCGESDLSLLWSREVCCVINPQSAIRNPQSGVVVDFNTASGHYRPPYFERESSLASMPPKMRSYGRRESGVDGNAQ
ncbi:MAG: hypothetical protein JMDDDDMK_04572 [Acidobacteria bacterium]|nr:hypothetical protein [Acidobacteriota bacterium]